MSLGVKGKASNALDALAKEEHIDITAAEKKRPKAPAEPGSFLSRQEKRQSQDKHKTDTRQKTRHFADMTCWPRLQEYSDLLLSCLALHNQRKKEIYENVVMTYTPKIEAPN
jgi:hypothetical protein